MYAIPKLRRLVVVTTAAGCSYVPFEDGRGRIDTSPDLMSPMTIGAGRGCKITFLQDGLSVDTLLKQRHNPRSRNPFPGDDVRIGMAAGTGFVDLRAMDRRYGVAARRDGVGCVAGHAGRKVPGFFTPSGSMNAGLHLRGLAAMARHADTVGIRGYLPDLVAAMTGDAIGAGAAAVQLRMSAPLNLLMERTMACAATDRPRDVGVRPF